MAEINELLVQLLNDRRVPIRQFKQQSEHMVLTELGRLMSQLKAAYPAATITPETATMWIGLWKEIVEDYGLETFARALKNCLRAKLFLPQPAEIEIEIRALIEGEQKVSAAHREKTKFKKCIDCNCQCDSATGMIVLRDQVGEDTWVGKSECWMRWNFARNEHCVAIDEGGSVMKPQASQPGG